MCSLKHKLPHIVVKSKTIPLRFIIDTGATHSVINPNLCHPKWYTKLKEPLQLKTLNHVVNIHEVVNIPLFEELSSSSQKVEFLVCDFHDRFDGLIGNNILMQIKAVVDYRTNHLIVGEKKIKLCFDSNNKTNDVGSGNEYEEMELDLTVSQKDGLGFIKERQEHSIIIEEGIYNIENFKMQTKVRILKNDLNGIEIPQPLEVEEVDGRNYNIIERENLNGLAIIDQLRIDHLNLEEKEALLKVVERFTDIFYKEHADLTFTNIIKHKIRTINDIPIQSKTYRYPYIHKEEVEKQIQEMLEKNIIRHSNSPYSAPIWIVPKKADASGKTKWRLVIDYRKLNEVTVDDKYPIPNMDEILEKLGNCQYFTTLDLAKGYHQIEIDEQDVHKTAFSVENGHY